MPISRAHIFNYNKIEKNFRSDNFVRDCKESDKEYDHTLKHIITGDVNILENDMLREIMLKGTKHRPPIKYTSEGLIKIFKREIYAFTYKMAVKYSMPSQAFLEWSSKIIKKYRWEIGRARIKYKNYTFYFDYSSTFLASIEK